MPKIAFREMPSYLTTARTMKEGGTHERRRALANFVLKTIREHEAGGIQQVTSRQLYYRLVAANAVPNSEKSYKMVTGLLADMRYWGLIDWNFIVDLGRSPIIPSQFDDINDLAETAVRSLRYDRWAGQENYAEIWVEKQALQSVLAPIGRTLHVAVVVNKGYSSASAVFEASRRLRTAEKGGRAPNVIYFGDHDPSGEDMVRDIGARLSEFGVDPVIRKVALTLEQVLEHECPPNPAKSSDSRYEGFADEMRSSDVYQQICDAQGLDSSDIYSWELDSLPVNVLQELVTTSVEDLITNPDLVEEIKAKEEKDKRALRRAANAIANGEFEEEEGEE